MNYLQARSMFKDGDVVCVNAVPFSHWKTWHALVFPIIAFFTGSKFAHTGTALWDKDPATGEDRLMIVESTRNYGRRVAPMSTYWRNGLTVFHMPEGFDTEAMKKEALAGVGKVSYGTVDFISIGLFEFFGIKPSKNYDGQVCSELSATLCKAGGMQIENTLVSPGALAKLLREKNLKSFEVDSAWEMP